MTEHVIPALTVREKNSTKSCADCPSFSKDFEGGGACVSRGIPLAMANWPKLTIDTALENQAAKCELYGTRSEDNLTSYDKSIAIEIHDQAQPVVFPKSGSYQPHPQPARMRTSRPTCLECSRFISSSDFLANPMGSKLPKTFSGVCAATGKAIPINAGDFIAEECHYYKSGSFPTEGLYSIHLLPEYDQSHLKKSLEKSGKKVSTGLPEGFDPLSYVSEFAVSPEDIAAGIRAWVGVSDTKSTNRVLLPIYRRDFFPSEDQQKIPNTDDETLPGEYVDHANLVFKVAVAWIELDETPCLIGEAGTGKTELLRHLAWIMQLPFERITITASSEIDDLAGKMLFEDGETVFHHGRLARAWGKPNVICLDEPNTGPNDVLQFIRPLIDNSKQLVVDQNKGEQIQRNQGCFLGMAMNPAYDYKNVGANTMADADNSRLFHVEVPLPPPETEREIIKARLVKKDGWEIPEELLSAVMAISKTLRQMSKDEEVPFSWGIRVQIKVARLLRWFDFQDSYLMAMGSSVDDETREKIIAVVKAHTPNRRA